MIKSKLNFFLATFTFSFITNICYGLNKNLLNAKKSLVQISFSSHVSASIMGKGLKKITGVIISKKNKLILTKNSYWGKDNIGTYIIHYSDGSSTSAKLVYTDPWLDIKFLEAKDMPDDATNELIINNKTPKVNQKIYTLDNHGNFLKFIVGEGIVSDTTSISEILSYQIYTLSLKNQSSNNCYPILNKKGEMIAFKISNGHTYAQAIPSKYVSYLKKYLDKGKIPPRKHIGIITEKKSYSKYKLYRGLNTKYKSKEDKFFKNSEDKIICIKSCIKGSPSYGKFQNGDILYKINEQRVFPHLSFLDMIFNNFNQNKISIEVIRNNKIEKIEVELMNINKYKIRDMVQIGNTLIFKADLLYSYIFDIALGDILLLYNYIGFGNQTSLDIDIRILNVKKIDGKEILGINQNELDKIMINAVKKGKFNVKGKELMNINKLLYTNKYVTILDLYFDKFHILKRYNWNNNKKEWTTKDLLN